MKIYLCVFFLLLAGCATYSVETDLDISHVESSLSVLDFNRVARKYVERPTFVSISTGQEQGDALWVKVSRYSGDVHLLLPANEADRYIEQIDKYFEWREIAIDRGDVVDKEISTVPGLVNGPIAFEIKAKFYSAAQGYHLLVLNQCMRGCGSVATLDSFYFDSENATKLRELMVRLKAGDFQHTDMSVYQ